MRLKSLILISHCRLACNCLGSRRLPARLQPRCEDGGDDLGPSVAQICSAAQLNNGI